ncbi:MAG: class I SAM-dependent methyltransferase [Longimicrobiales bacterium]
MKLQEAVVLLNAAQPAPAGTWADLGAGTGTFTRALGQLLGRDGHIYAVDRDGAALATLRAAPARSGCAAITTVQADFTGPLRQHLPDPLAGLLLANALHFVPNPHAVLAQLSELLRPGGQVILIEYDRRPANRWVPHPIWIEHLPALAAAAHLDAPRVVARRPSAYGGDLYVAVSHASA